MIDRIKKVFFNLRNRQVLLKNIGVIGSENEFGSGFRLVESAVMPTINFTLGSRNYLDCAVHFERSHAKVVVGDNCFLGRSKIVCANSVVIEENTTISWGVTITDHDSHSKNMFYRRRDHALGMSNLQRSHPWAEDKDWLSVVTEGVTIRADSWIGFGATILKGVTIGEGAVVGANSVVTKDVPSFKVVAGNPAVIVGSVD